MHKYRAYSKRFKTSDNIFDRPYESVRIRIGIAQICIVSPLYAVGEQDLLFRIVFIFRVFAEITSLSALSSRMPRWLNSLPGEQDFNKGDLRHEREAEFSCKSIRIIGRIVFQMIDTPDDRMRRSPAPLLQTAHRYLHSASKMWTC